MNIETFEGNLRIIRNLDNAWSYLIDAFQDYPLRDNENIKVFFDVLRADIDCELSFDSLSNFDTNKLPADENKIWKVESLNSMILFFEELSKNNVNFEEVQKIIEEISVPR